MPRILAALLLAASIISPACADGWLEAIEQGDHARLQTLLSQGLPPDGELTTHPLSLALIQNDVVATQLLLDAGVGRGQLDRYLLFVDRNPAPLKLLLDHGANPNGLVLNTSALHHFIGEGRLDHVRLLLERGATIHAPGRDERSALMAVLDARREQRPPLLELLLQQGAKLQARDNQGRSLIHLAAADGDRATLAWAQAHGLSLDDQDVQGISGHGYLLATARGLRQALQTPLESHRDADVHYAFQTAVAADDYHVLDALLSRRPALAQSTEALVRAVDKHNVAALQLLLAAGATANTPATDGLPLVLHAIANAGEDRILPRLLLAAGARLGPKPPAGYEQVAAIWALAEPDRIPLWRHAGLTLASPYNGRPLQQALTSHGADMKPWRQRLTPLPKPAFGPALLARRTELIGIWEDDNGARWQFNPEGQFRAEEKALFMALLVAGTWSVDNHGLRIQLTSPEAGQRFHPLLSLSNDELVAADLLGNRRFRRISRTVTSVQAVPAAPVSSVDRCARASKHLELALQEGQALAAAGAEGKIALPASAIADFAGRCATDYGQSERTRTLVDCLQDKEGLFGVIACLALDAEANQQPSLPSSP